MLIFILSLGTNYEIANRKYLFEMMSENNNFASKIRRIK